MKRTIAVIGLALVLLLGSCSLPGVNPSAGYDSIDAVLRNLPEPQMQLPASLGGDSDSTARTVTTTYETLPVSLQDIADVKSYAWRELSEPNILFPFIRLAFHKLKSYAETHDVVEGQVLTFSVSPTEPEMVEIDAPSDLMTTVNMKVVGDEKDFTIYLFVDMSYDNMGTPFEIPIYSALRVYDDGEYRVDMSSFVHTEMNGDISEFSVYLNLGFETGTGDMAIRVHNTDGVDIYDYSSFERSYLQADGSYVRMGKYGEDPDYVSIAYGNDSYGGIASVYSSSYREWDEGLGDWVENSDGYNLNGEFYNSSGNIIYSMWGTTAIRDYGWDGYNIYGTSPSAAPETVTIIRRGSYPDYQYFLDDGVTEITGQFGYDPATDEWHPSTVVWKQDDSHFQSGDWMYDCYDWWTYSGADESTLTLSKSSQVPAGSTYFGKTFFVDKEYPLATLLPLTAAYAGDYTLLEDRETNYDDYDTPDTSDDWSWTWSNFYLDNSTQGTPGSLDENDIRIDNLYSWDTWKWNDDTQDWDIVEVPVYSTNGSVPAYFTQPDIDATYTVRDKLENIYQTEYQSFGIADYQAQLDSIDPEDPIFDDLK